MQKTDETTQTFIVGILKLKPWIQGPIENIIHGIEHYYYGYEKDYRFALIHCDNAVELAMKAFIRFHNPEIYRKIRKDWKKISRNYENLIKVIRDNLPSIPKRLDSELLYYHKIRNELYHAGYTSPRKRDVANFIWRAITFFEVLFSTEMDKAIEEDLYNKCVLAYAELDSLLWTVCKKEHVRSYETAGIQQLIRRGVFTREIGEKINEVIELRESLIAEKGRGFDLYNLSITLDEIISELQTRA